MTTKIDGTSGVLQSYDYQVLTTGFTYTFAAGTTTLIANPAGTLAAGTITMPAAPADGMAITFNSTQIITALIVLGNAGQSIVNAVTTLAAGGGAKYIYRLTNTTWYRTAYRTPMTITINGTGIITGASTLATTVASPTLTTPNIDSAQFATVTGTAPIYPCRAWVNFDGTGTIAIRNSGNVSSITDNGTGDYTVNFTTSMPDANYAISCAGTTLLYAGIQSTLAAGTARVTTRDAAAALADSGQTCVAIFR